MIMKEKIYCDDCKYSENGMDNPRCMFPKFITLKDTPYKQQEIHPFCREINKNNDCKHFEVMRLTEYNPFWLGIVILMLIVISERAFLITTVGILVFAGYWGLYAVEHKGAKK